VLSCLQVQSHVQVAIWFNPPFDLNVKTNIGKAYLSIIDNSFPEEHPLRKIFNRNTLKVSYCCTPNIKSTIDGHNKTQLQNTTERVASCNCRDKNKCPLDGECRRSGIVYQATVQSQELATDGAVTVVTEKYVGLTDTEFKKRLANHKQSFTKSNLKYATELSKYVWTLKNRNKEYIINWKILDKARAYTNKTKKCNLCVLEKYYIICHPEKSTLNQRCGLVSSCRHSSKFLLNNHPT
jgi:hypothetical protein